MAVLGFHASHEQIAPSELLTAVQHAEAAGFEAAMCSDHFMPWSQRQGHSGFAFSWLGAALASTRFTIGSVCAPGQRYHPAVVAQAAATLGEMFEGRYWMALGAGQNMNEHITADPWPPEEVRRQRLEESAELIRRLHTGEWIHHHSGHTQMQDAYIYDRSQTPVPLYAACISPESARRAAAWADGMITVNQPEAAHRETLSAYREAGGAGPVMLQVHLSWAETRQQAEEIADHQWRTHTFGPRWIRTCPHRSTSTPPQRISRSRRCWIRCGPQNPRSSTPSGLPRRLSSVTPSTSTTSGSSSADGWTWQVSRSSQLCDDRFGRTRREDVTSAHEDHRDR